MGQAKARIISHPHPKKDQKLEQTAADQDTSVAIEQSEEDFLQELAGQSRIQEQLQSRQKSCLAEISLLRDENKWQQIVDLFHPLQEKEPELVRFNLELDLRMELGFALGQLNHFDQAVQEYETCIQTDQDNFLAHSGLAYTLYNSLYAAKNREILLTPDGKRQRTEKAHVHFQKAQELRPEAVTNYYRQGMLYKNLQNKPLLALPLFARAVTNWRNYSEEQQKNRHQEKKNYIKSLYNLGSCYLQKNQFQKALQAIQGCINQDSEHNLISALNKHFALGKVYYQLGEFQKASEALQFAKTLADSKDGDYVYELLGRVLLALKQGEKALQVINSIPEKLRRPYVRWTEADIFLALKRKQEAIDALTRALAKDRRSKHKTLIRLSRIYFEQKDFEQALDYASQADEFRRQAYTNPDSDALFWQAAALLHLNKIHEARQRTSELADFYPGYPFLGKLQETIKRAERKL